jgi:hypothetical protein
MDDVQQATDGSPLPVIRRHCDHVALRRPVSSRLEGMNASRTAAMMEGCAT